MQFDPMIAIEKNQRLLILIMDLMFEKLISNYFL